MNEAEWMECQDWHAMLLHLRRRRGVTTRKSGRRKLRLFACGCCRQQWGLLVHPHSREAVETAELYADGLATEEERAEAQRRAIAAAEVLFQHFEDTTDLVAEPFEKRRRYSMAMAASLLVAHGPLFTAMEEAVSWVGRVCNAAARGQFMRNSATLVRDVFGNPFRPIALKRACRTATAVQLARGIYHEHAFDRMPILADALQDAGCDDEAVLAHCRDANGIHILGCWVVDAIAGGK